MLLRQLLHFLLNILFITLAVLILIYSISKHTWKDKRDQIPMDTESVIETTMHLPEYEYAPMVRGRLLAI